MGCDDPMCFDGPMRCGGDAMGCGDSEAHNDCMARDGFTTFDDSTACGVSMARNDRRPSDPMRNMTHPPPARVDVWRPRRRRRGPAAGKCRCYRPVVEDPDPPNRRPPREFTDVGRPPRNSVGAGNGAVFAPPCSIRVQYHRSSTCPIPVQSGTRPMLYQPSANTVQTQYQSCASPLPFQ